MKKVQISCTLVHGAILSPGVEPFWVPKKLEMAPQVVLKWCHLVKGRLNRATLKKVEPFSEWLHCWSRFGMPTIPGVKPKQCQRWSQNGAIFNHVFPKHDYLGHDYFPKWHRFPKRLHFGSTVFSVIGNNISNIPCLRVALAKVAWDCFCALGGHRSGRGWLQQCHPQTRDVTILSS